MAGKYGPAGDNPRVHCLQAALKTQAVLENEITASHVKAKLLDAELNKAGLVYFAPPAHTR